MRLSLVLFFVVATALSAEWLAAQETLAKSDLGQRAFLGDSDCFTCHTLGLPQPNDPKLKAIKARFPKLVFDSWVKMDEWSTWGDSDKHNQAFISLLPDNKRSKRMGELLDVEVHRDKRCLACHTAYPLSALDSAQNSDPQAPHLIREDLVKDPKVAQGISCEGCHAPSGDGVANGGAELKGWNTPHRFKDSWRFLPANDKWTKFGYADVRSPSSRTRICLSCHLGNAAEGKIVTHEMYAAGHPPLPGFELATFVDQMPKHWRNFGEKSPAVQEEFLRLSEDAIRGRKETYKPDALSETNHLLVAALVAYSENLKLSAALADQTPSIPLKKKPEWPELAQFECFACHHDLQDSSWRQGRKLRGVPGRPLLRAWPTPLTMLAVKQAGADERKFTELRQKVDDLLNRQPFGGHQSWNEIVKDAKWLDELATSLEKQPLSRDSGLPLLREIAAIAESDLWDYDSARQLVWAAKVLCRELASEQSPEETRTRIKSLEANFAEVEQLFVLKLIDGQTAQQRFPGETESREVTLVDLVKTLPPIAKYNAAMFRDKFHTFADKLSAK